MKIIFNGGYPSPVLPNGLKAVNTGAHIQIGENTYEAMSPEYSEHPTKIVSKYIRVPSRGKVEISIHRENNLGEFKFGIAYYRNDCDVQSFRYTSNVPKKWDIYFDELKDAYRTIFE